MASILVFDSGVGGLSILDAIQAHPHSKNQGHQWLFCSDNAFFPYGTKDADVLINRVKTVLTAASAIYQPDIIVIACNTASTIALEAVRNVCHIPIVGVVPAIKPAAQSSRSRSIGLLATPGTISRTYTSQLIAEFASDCMITKVGSSQLVKLVENYLRCGELDIMQLQSIVEPFRRAIDESHLDTIVLACTHFPLIVHELKKLLPSVSFWIDSGEAVANRVQWCLTEIKENIALKTMQDTIGEAGFSGNVALFTSLDQSAEILRGVLSKFDIHQMCELPISESG